MDTAYYSNLMKNKSYIEQKIKKQPKIGIVLGSGWDSLVNEFPYHVSVPFSELIDFPIPTISTHKGNFIFTEAYGMPIVLMQGRVHYYEGYSMQEVTKPIRLMRLLGVEKIILTNAAGGINENLNPGDLMIITGQIASFVPSPLNGKNEDKFGIRFPDMSNIYSKKFQSLIEKSAAEENITIKKGVFIQTAGPQYETPEEINMYKIVGADAVAMSTACEAITAIHCGMEVCGISCITNKAAGITSSPLSHEEVKETADKSAEKLKKLIKRTLFNLEKNLIMLDEQAFK